MTRCFYFKINDCYANSNIYAVENAYSKFYLMLSICVILFLASAIVKQGILFGRYSEYISGFSELSYFAKIIRYLDTLFFVGQNT